MMKSGAMAGLILAAWTLAGSAVAAGPSTTTVCLDVRGSTLPVVCRVTGERLATRDVFCQCPDGQRTEAPLCGPGQKPPAETRALDAARRDLGRDGSLVGDLYLGKPICVSPRRP